VGFGKGTLEGLDLTSPSMTQYEGPGMKILITGNMGYVGAVVSRHLRQALPNAFLVGLDTAFFAHALSNAATLPERELDEQRFGDVRDLTVENLADFDGVVHLAAVSNDPMGNRFEAVTHEINCKASARLAQLANEAGVKRFVFASSCSVYGFAPGAARKEIDPLNPQTAYAKSKVDTERLLSGMNHSSMVTTCLRFATACGMSDRLRLDLVLNDFVACSVAEKRITVLSDGTPWRPLIDVRDMARAIEWALCRSGERGGAFLSVNVGSEEWNYQVRDLADAVARADAETIISINKQAQPDTRSYKVDFSLFKSLAPDHQPRVTLQQSIARLRDGLLGMNFGDRNFRSSHFMRLKILESHIENGRISPSLRWVSTN
jgi:nucleoside-diphosphate-sugar epimerase